MSVFNWSTDIRGKTSQSAADSFVNRLQLALRLFKGCTSFLILQRRMQLLLAGKMRNFANNRDLLPADFISGSITMSHSPNNNALY